MATTVRREKTKREIASEKDLKERCWEGVEGWRGETSD